MLNIFFLIYNIIKILIFFEFIISFILILIFVLTLLKDIFVNVYCFTAFHKKYFNIFLMFLFQNFLLNKFFYTKSFYVFPDKNSTIYTFDTLLTLIFIKGFHYSIRYNFLYMYNSVFYTKIFKINI